MVSAQRLSNSPSQWGLCPAGCPTNHGGPRAALHLAEDWREIPPEHRPTWSEYATLHGRPILGEQPAPPPSE